MTYLTPMIARISPDMTAPLEFTNTWRLVMAGTGAGTGAVTAPPSPLLLLLLLVMVIAMGTDLLTPSQEKQNN